MAIRFEQWEEEFQHDLCREWIVGDCIDPFLQYDDVDLYAQFRFCRAELLRITGLLDSDLQHNTNRNLALSLAMQVCLALRYFATGSSQNLVGDSVQIKTTKAHVQTNISRAIPCNA